MENDKKQVVGGNFNNYRRNDKDPLLTTTQGQDLLLGNKNKIVIEYKSNKIFSSGNHRSKIYYK